MDIRRFLGRSRVGGGPHAKSSPPDHLEAPAPEPRVVQFSRKRARSGEALQQPAAATVASEDQQELQEAEEQQEQQPANIAAPPASPQQQQQWQGQCQQQQQQQQQQQRAGKPWPPPRQLTQTFLDLGQRDFHSSRCPRCGMLYCKGEESDERLHAAFHATATKGLRYSSSLPGERVVLSDGAAGRVVMLPGGDAARSKKVQELQSFLEEQMGLAKGWLLATGGTLFLYVSSASKRVQACVVAEAIKDAFAAVPAGPAGGGAAGPRPAASAGSAARPATSSAGASSSAGADGCVTGSAAAAGAEAQPLFSVTRSSGGGAADDATAHCAAEAGEKGRAAAGPPAGAAGLRAPELPAASASPLPPQQEQQQQQRRQGLLLDRRRRLRAVCGVRLVWVAADARRGGLATKLLDCVRSALMAGYVVPRHELAFSAPTDAGAALAAAYAGGCAQRFLVYE